MSEVLEDEVLASNIIDRIEFVETDAEVIASDLISKFEERLGEALYPGDERRLFLQGIAYVIADQLVHINETGRSNMLRYAEGSALDALGELYNNKRLEAKPASTTIAFTLSTVPSFNITIPKGTRVTPEGMTFFATDEDITFNKGEPTLTKEVSATSTMSGADYNDFEVGQINNLVDSNPYIASVTNTVVSSGGSDIETDDDYRERLRLSPFSLSVAGPANAYEAIALSVSGDIGDVAVYSPSAGVVEIAVIKDGGEIPSEDDTLLDDILEACNDKYRRPLTDKVQVVPATAVNVNIDLTYYLNDSDTSKIAAIENAVESYIKWQTEKIGRTIDPDELNMLMREAGASRVVITEPAYQIIAENEVAQIGTINIVNGGSISSKARSV